MGSVNIAFIVLSIVVVIMVLSAVPRRGKRLNMAHYSFAGWTFTTLLLYTVNGIRWRENTLNSSPRYCDFSSMIFVMYAMAVPATALTLSHRLFCRLQNKEDKGIITDIYAVATDISFCVGLPLLHMAARFIFHGKSRYTIYGDYGCTQDVFKSAASQSLVYIPLMTVSIIAFGYLVASVMLWNRMNHGFDKCHYATEPSQKQSVTPSCFYRHSLLSAIFSLITFTFGLWQMIMNLAFGPVFYGINEATETDAIHNIFSDITFMPADQWQKDVMRSSTIEYSRWIVIAFGLVFFFMFGPVFSTECQQAYVVGITTIIEKSKGLFKKPVVQPRNFKLAFGFPEVFRHQSTQEKVGDSTALSATAFSMDTTASHRDALSGLPVWIDPSAFPTKPAFAYPASSAATMTSETLVSRSSPNGEPDVPSDVSSKHESIVIAPSASVYDYSRNTVLSSKYPASRGKTRSTVTVPDTPSVYSFQSAPRGSSHVHGSHLTNVIEFPMPQFKPVVTSGSGAEKRFSPKVPEHGSFLFMEPQTPSPNGNHKWHHGSQAV